MTPEHALLSIALHAAFADGQQADAERTHIRRLADGFPEAAAGLAELYQQVLLGRQSLDQAVAALTTEGQRQLAYEMALGVCEADGRRTSAESSFLQTLRERLQLVAIPAAADTTTALRAATDATIPVTVQQTTEAAPNRADSQAIDQRILKYAILNGALELLPQSWATMAIIPLQMKLVYGIGTDHGYRLDQGHIKEFLATAGVGLTSQYVEQFGRKLLGGLLGQLAGRSVGRIGSAATGVAFSFASTYALGHLAKQYYGNQRQMSTQDLRTTFQSLLPGARQLQQQYLPQIQAQAAKLGPTDVMSLMRDQSAR